MHNWEIIACNYLGLNCNSFHLPRRVVPFMLINPIHLLEGTDFGLVSGNPMNSSVSTSELVSLSGFGGKVSLCWVNTCIGLAAYCKMEKEKKILKEKLEKYVCVCVCVFRVPLRPVW